MTSLRDAALAQAGQAGRSGKVKRAMVAACAMAAVASGGLIAAPAVHAADGDNPGLRFGDNFNAGQDQVQFIGNCFTAGGNATFGGPRHTDCGVDRVAYNATGQAFRTNQQQHTYVGNTIDVRGGSVTLIGGVYEGNRIIADRIVIREGAILVGGNQLEGEVDVENPQSVASELYVDRVVHDDIEWIADNLHDVERATGWFLSEANFNRLDTAGEYVNPTPDGAVRIHNVSAAVAMGYEMGLNAGVLAANDFAHFSAVVTSDGPRDPDEGDPAATIQDFRRLRDQTRECRERMELAFPRGAGAALDALLDCSDRTTAAAVLSDDVSDRLTDIMR